MITPEGLELYLQFLGIFAAAGVIIWLLERDHKKKVAAAEQAFQITLAAIEARNKLYKKD